MTREYIETQCRRISLNYTSSGVCRFARGGGTLCFIDTSQEQNGTRGIAFLRDEMTVFFGSGEPCEIAYSDIKSLQIISSFEDFYADELAVIGEDFEIIISDYSLEKSELKRFIEELCAESKAAGEHRAQAEEYARIIAQRLSENAFHEEHSPEMRSAEIITSGDKTSAGETYNTETTFSGEDPDPLDDQVGTDDLIEPGDTDNFDHKEDLYEADDFVSEDGTPVITESTVIKIPNERTLTLPEDYMPAPIPDDKINWISGSFYEKTIDVPEETPEITVAEPVLETVPEDIPAQNIYGEAPRVISEETETPSKPIVLYSREYEEEAVQKPEWQKSVQELENREERKSVGEGIENTGNTDNVEFAGNNRPDSDALVQIQNMSREETLSFLAESLGEINGIENDYQPEEPVDEPNGKAGEPEPPFDIGADLKTISEIAAPPEEDAEAGKLTVEPIWGDIYIKASRNLRELIESGRLSMEQIETELKDKLLSSARAFVEITADEAKVPKVLMPRITELKSAAGGIEEYFKSGEDIAVRAMFFMMYQMLSYADRIAETPETKERLNDFFRRFGSAGITLSMLDMRV